jgi:hypothetical protein
MLCHALKTFQFNRDGKSTVAETFLMSFSKFAAVYDLLGI